MVSLLNELLFLIRNSDIFTVTERNVTTRTDTATLTGATTYLINRTDVKNIRTLTVGGNTKLIGRDFNIDTDYLDSGVKKCQISFISSQTGALSVTYDYGTDKIFTDYPRNELSLSSYPRIAIMNTSETVNPFGLGGQSFIEDTIISVYMFADNSDYLNSHMETLKGIIETNAKSLYNSPWMYPIGKNANAKEDLRNQEILVNNLDVRVRFKVVNT